MHKPVLLKQTVEALNLLPGNTAMDLTGGAGGHSIEIASKVGETGTLFVLDQDKNAVQVIEDRLKDVPAKIIVEKSNFRDLDKVLEKHHQEKVDAFLFDLGFSSDQIESSGRGFSFLRDEPLLMTMSTESSLTAMDIVNTYSEQEIGEILKNYGEESFFREISKGIVEARKKSLITKTSELVEVIKTSTPAWYSKKRINEATKTFQALRIAVNDELGVIEKALPKALERLSSGGRIAVITFHSLEDRIIKEIFVKWEKEGLGKRVNKKVIVAERSEVLDNPRSRSAKLRVFQKN